MSEVSPDSQGTQKACRCHHKATPRSVQMQDDLQKRLVVTSRCYFRECIGNACRTAEGRTKKDIR
ncbi:MAG: hypothetical protein U0N58_00040, partial [Senegalimassilia anaerobia]